MTFLKKTKKKGGSLSTELGKFKKELNSLRKKAKNEKNPDKLNNTNKKINELELSLGINETCTILIKMTKNVKSALIDNIDPKLDLLVLIRELFFIDGESKNNIFNHFNIENLKLSVDLNNFLADDRDEIINIREGYFYNQYNYLD